MNKVFLLCCMNKLKHQSPVLQLIRMKSLFHRGVRFFFKKNLLFTNSITSGGCMAIGDLFQQEFDFQSKLIPERYDWARAGRMFIVGVLLGPFHHYYYIYLDKVLPKTDMKTISVKIVCDQAFVSPASLVIFFYAMGALEKKPMQTSTEEIKSKLKYVYLGDCLFWPPIQFINFYYLPTHYRVFYTNVATVIFNVFLSYMKHYDQH